MSLMKEFLLEVKSFFKTYYKFFRFIIIILLFLLSSLFKLIPIYIFNIDSNNITPTINCLLTLFSNSVTAIFCIFLFFKELKKDFIELKKMEKNKLYIKFDSAFRYWLIGLVIMIASNYFIGKIGISTSNNDVSVQTMLDASPFIAGLSVVFIAPFIEEITFRKAFKDLFEKKWFFILLSGIIFGSLHVIFSVNYWYDLLYLIPYCSLGIAFSYIYYNTDNFYFSYFIHILHNLLTAFTTFLLAGVLI